MTKTQNNSTTKKTDMKYNIISVVKRLIAINRIQNKSFYLHNICVCTVYIYYVYTNTHTCMYIFKGILHHKMITTDGRWRCFSNFSGPFWSVFYLAVNGTVTSLPVLIQNILNYVTKTNKAFTGLERHGVSKKMTKLSFWCGVSL